MTEGRGGSAWRWHAPDQAAEGAADGAGLLYEPGNWGDALKGSWALVALRSLLVAEGPTPLRYLDVCAGQPTYPLSDSAARRMASVDGGFFREAQAVFKDRGRIASTGWLVREACALAGVDYELQVFDADPARRERWRSLENVRVLDVSSGEEALASTEADLTLVDPYDLFDHWGRWLPGVFEAAQRALVLVYLYNKSPRGPGFLDQYGRLRAQLRSAVTGRTSVLLGRLASDAESPRAHHEVVLLGPTERLHPVKSALAAETRLLARAVADDGAFEEIGPVDKV